MHRLLVFRLPRFACTAIFALLFLQLPWEFISRGSTVPPGFTETVVPGPTATGGVWNQAVGVVFENNGRMYVWERTGKVWYKDPNDASFSLLLDISEEVGPWVDH